LPPTADAGPDQSTRVGSWVSLDGGASFDDNTASSALQYAWSFSYRPAGSAAVLSGANTATPIFVADVADSFSLRLVVTDGAGHTSAPDFVEVSTSNLPPTADAGADQLVVVGRPVALDGSASSDPEHESLGFGWTLTRPEGSSALFVDAGTATPTLYTDDEGTYSVELVVSDALGPGTPDSVTITAVVPNEYVEQVVVEVADTITELPSTSVTTGGNKSALNAYLQHAATASSAGNATSQIASLERAIERTDGCALRGQPDPSGPTRDWVTTCEAQAQVYPDLKAALDAALAAATP
jgi:hypothetical protein